MEQLCGMNKLRLHRLSAMFLGTFILMHLLNHLVALVSIEEHLSSMETLRKAYRQPLIEMLLLLSVGIQIWTGLGLLFGKRGSTNSFYDTLQRWSGAYLGFFLLFHLAAVFTGRLLLEVDTNVYFGAAGLNTFPYYFFFVPYYGLAIMAIFGHGAAIHRRKMRRKVLRLTVPQQTQIILFVGLIITVVTLYGLTNSFIGMDIPEPYRLPKFN